MADPVDTAAIRDLPAVTTPTLRDGPWVPLSPAERDALCDEVDALRREVAVLEQVCRDQRERVPAKTRDIESGIYIGGPSCEHPNVVNDADRCRWCGATGGDL